MMSSFPCKKIARSCVFAFLFALAFAFRADAQLLSVKAEPRWPWNGLVDITVSVPEGTVAATGSNTPVFLRLYGHDETTGAEVAMRTLSSDGVNFVTHPAETAYPLGATGTRKFVWDAAKDNPAFNASSFTVRAELSKGVLTYRVVDLQTGEFWGTDSAPDLNDDTCRTTQLWLRRIPAGVFMMGSPESEWGRRPDRETQHQVTLTRGFYIGVFEMTAAQHDLIAGVKEEILEYGEYCEGKTRPMILLSYDEIRGTGVGMSWPAGGHAVDEDSFLAKLRAKTGLEFDLPTEAQWEYACRAGTTTSLNSGKNMDNETDYPKLMEVARCFCNYTSTAWSSWDGKGGYSGRTVVGCYLPNAWGLYDMHGNVGEWCLDWIHSYYYPDAVLDYPGGAMPVTDPVGHANGDLHAVRGGGYYIAQDSSDYRSAHRGGRSDWPHDKRPTPADVGFRVVCPF